MNSLALFLAAASSLSVIHLLIGLVILALVIWVVWLIINLLPFPAPIKQIITAVFALICLLVLLNWLGLF